MTKRVFSLDLFTFLLLAGLFAHLSHLLLADPDDNPNYGAYHPIEDIHDPHVIEIAEFAVSELNKELQKKLVFQSVVRGESQVVAGQNYKLVVAVKDQSSYPTSSVNYECVVWEKVWLKFRKLTFFHEVKT
ncbi:cysteine proteinase inhibitor 1 [Rosa sericea]